MNQARHCTGIIQEKHDTKLPAWHENCNSATKAVGFRWAYSPGSRCVLRLCHPVQKLKTRKRVVQIKLKKKISDFPFQFENYFKLLSSKIWVPWANYQIEPRSFSATARMVGTSSPAEPDMPATHFGCKSKIIARYPQTCWRGEAFAKQDETW